MRISDWSSDVCSSDLARSLATFPLRTAGADPDGAARVAIIDIGSNSIRLVVYQGPPRLPQVLFNEKVMAGLGRGLASRSEERRVGKEWGSTCRSRWSPVS